MELIERAGFLMLLQTQFLAVADGEGHCVFVSGEAGIGKTSLVKSFCTTLKKNYNIYTGSCDALFTPRPLAPVYDILLQAHSDLWKGNDSFLNRPALFTDFFHELGLEKKAFVVVFEDIHWADEATLDFIKFFARRITQLRCLFILTYRDSEISAQHPLKNVLGQLPPDFFTRMPLPALSKEAVDQMASRKGYSGQAIYSISGGNPFYVNEILASYSPGIPDNIKDSVLSVYNRQHDPTKQLWQIVSILPTGIEIKFLEKMEAGLVMAADESLATGILNVKDGLIRFKHELYRRTIEGSLSPLLRVALNKKILDLFCENFEQQQQPERIIHHAKNANDYERVVQYAPVAAKNAAGVGAHIEACRLYLSAIEYYQGNDKALLVHLYEAYAYECYLTNQMKEAIIYTGKAMAIWKDKNDIEKTGNCLRFLSRLWWFEGNRKNAEAFAVQAIEVLNRQPPSRVKAMALSNMSQLKMLSKETDSTIFWGEQAIAMAEALGDEEILCHALNNVGTVQIKIGVLQQTGTGLLQKSLDIALKNGYGEHVARAYTNQGSNMVAMKDYKAGKKALDDGIHYCEENGLDSWTAYMLSWRARLLLETGHWKEAEAVAENLLKNDNQPPVVKISVLAVMATLKLRRGDADAVPLLLEAKVKALETGELQRIVPALIALLEYEWITGSVLIESAVISNTLNLIGRRDNSYEDNEFAFWLQKTRKQLLPLEQIAEGYDISTQAKAMKAAAIWERIGCPYEQAIALFEGKDESKRLALGMVHALGATVVYEKMKQDMRNAGIKNIPRGARKSTQSNTAYLTERELDVLQLLKEGMQNKEIAGRLFISAKTVDHHISAILFKLDVNSRTKAVQEALRLNIIR